MRNIHKTISVLLLALCILSMLSCRRETPAERKAQFNKQVSDLVEVPGKNLGANRSSVQSKLGVPAAIKSEQITNIHDPRQTDLIHTLTYKGLDVLIHDVVSFKKEMLFCVRMIANHPSVLPELIGQDENAIKAKFGDPTRIKGKIFEYDLGDERVQIEFVNSTVVAIQWNLYVD